MNSRIEEEEKNKERERIFAKLSKEDEEFRKKILDLHRKLSDVDEDSVQSAPLDKKPEKRVTLVDSLPPKQSESEKILKPALKTFSRASSTDKPESNQRIIDKRKLKKMDLEFERRKHLEQLKKRSDKIDQVSEEENDDQTSVRPQETNFLHRLRIRRRSIKLLSFLSGKLSDKAQEERAARLLKMYMPEKNQRGQNTISIHHNSRDRRFWKVRTRRRSNSS